MRKFGDGCADFDAGNRARESLQEISDVLAVRQAALQYRQAGRRIAHRAGDIDRIARPRARARHRLAGIDVGDNLDADDGFAAARRVATDQRHAVFIRRFEQAARKFLQPRRIGMVQCQRQCHPARPSAHCRNIGKIDDNGAITDIRRIETLGKMNA